MVFSAWTNTGSWTTRVKLSKRTSRGVPTKSYEVKLSQNRPQHRALLEEHEEEDRGQDEADAQARMRRR